MPKHRFDFNESFDRATNLVQILHQVIPIEHLATDHNLVFAKSTGNVPHPIMAIAKIGEDRTERLLIAPYLQGLMVLKEGSAHPLMQPHCFVVEPLTWAAIGGTNPNLAAINTAGLLALE
jgi:hypothetical protein